MAKNGILGVNTMSKEDNQKEKWLKVIENGNAIQIGGIIAFGSDTFEIEKFMEVFNKMLHENEYFFIGEISDIEIEEEIEEDMIN